MKEIIKRILFCTIPLFHDWYKYRVANLWLIGYFKYVYKRLFGIKPYWPIEPGCIVGEWKKIYVGRNSNVGRPGCYIQGGGGIYIGDYVRVTTNVGIMSRNHDLYDHRVSHMEPVIIHDYCWLGMGCKVLAGVELGPRTIVAAGAVVTKSFPEGNCVIGGVPAKKIKDLDPYKVQHYKLPEEMYGYLTPDQFERYKRTHLKDCPFLDKNYNLTIFEDY